MHNRFFPGPQGTEGIVAIPMTDFNLRNDLPQDVLEAIMRNTESVRKELRELRIAHGNKISANLRRDVDPETGGILLAMRPTLTKHVTVNLPLPETNETRAQNPQTVEKLFECLCNVWRGGNAANILSNKVRLAQAGIGAAHHQIFTPQDLYLTPWLGQETSKGDAIGRFDIHTLTDIPMNRIGTQLPFLDDGKPELFSINRPQPSTIAAMRNHSEHLRHCDHVIVSEGLERILQENQIDISQLFNPTSALHIESALQMLERKERNASSDMVFINEDEMDLWIRVMENRLTGAQFDPKKNENTAAFPMPFSSDGIDENSVRISMASHQRFLRMIEPSEKPCMTNPMSVSCGKAGGQDLFQSEGQYFLGYSSALSDEGTAQLLHLIGNPEGISMNIRNVMGAGDASFTAATLAKLYHPLEDIMQKRSGNLNKEKQKIAAMAFVSMLKRIFGAIAYHTNQRNITDVPAEAFPKLLDTVVDRAIQAAEEMTVLTKAPQRFFEDKEFGLLFTAHEIDRQ